MTWRHCFFNTLSCLPTKLRCPPSCIWQSWSQAPAIPGWLAWLRGNLVASNIPDAGKAGKANQAASSVHGAASSPGCRGASLRHEMVRDPGPGRGRCSLRNVCIGQFTSKQAWLQPARPALFSPSLIQICPVNKAIHRQPSLARPPTNNTNQWANSKQATIHPQAHFRQPNKNLDRQLAASWSLQEVWSLRKLRDFLFICLAEDLGWVKVATLRALSN